MAGIFKLFGSGHGICLNGHPDYEWNNDNCEEELVRDAN